MHIDAILVDILAAETEHTLVGSRLQKIRQTAPSEFVLEFRTEGGKVAHLVLSLDSNRPGLALLFRRPSGNEKDVKSYCMFLRKHLQGARFLSSEHIPRERILGLHFEKRNDFGDLEKKCLLIEWTTPRCNLLLINEAGRIIDALRHEERKKDNDREIMPARRYQLPQALSKISRSEPGWEEDPQLEHFFRPEGRRTLFDLLGSIDSVGTVLRRAFFTSVSVDENRTCSSLAPEERKKFLREVDAWLKRHLAPPASAYAYFSRNLELRERRFLEDLARRLNQNTELELASLPSGLSAETLPLPCEIHAAELPQYPARIEFPSLLEAYAFSFLLTDRQRELRRQRKVYEEKLRRELKQLLRRREALKRDLESCRDLEEDQKKGQLIYANLAALSDTRRPSVLRVVDYYDAALPELELRLDPRFSPQENAARFLKQYRKKLRRRELAREFAASVETRLNLCRESLLFLEQSESEEEMRAIFENYLAGCAAEENPENALHPNETPAARVSEKRGKMQINLAGKGGNKRRRLLQKQKQSSLRSQKAAKKTEEISLPPRRFLCPDGAQILVGRNSRQNDRLTLHLAKKNELWFHLKNAPGTHLLLSPSGKGFAEENILAAASLCAYYSLRREELRQGFRTDVDCCPVSKVRKPRGAVAGFVIYDAERSLRVEAISPSHLGLIEQES